MDLLSAFEFQILVLICLLLARFGSKSGNILFFGGVDHTFLGIGTVVGYAIIVPAILVTYLLGANLTFLVRSTNNHRCMAIRSAVA